MKRIFIVSLLLSSLLFSGYVQAQPSSKADKHPTKDVSLEDVWAYFTFYPRFIQGLRSMEDGKHYSVQEESSIVQYSYETGEKVKVLVDGEKTTIDFTSYVFNKNEDKVLLSTEHEAIYRHSYIANYYVWDIKTEKLTYLSEKGKQSLASFSPDGNKVAYVRENNLYYFDLISNKEIQITKDGEFNKIINGAPDWVYEEEFSFSKGFAWSPDNRFIAFMKFDESAVKQWSMTMYGQLYPDQYTYKYPKAGEDNSIVSVHVYDLSKNAIVKMDVGEESDQYIPRIKWTKETGKLCITRLNRLQNQLDLLLADAQSGNSKVLLHEENKYYIDITDDLSFLDDQEHFIWTSEQDGYLHIYLYNMKGKKVRQITKGEWDITSFHGVDETNKLVYYTSAESSPTQRDLYVIGLDGKGKKNIGEKNGTNEADFSADFSYFINTWSDANTPPVTKLCNAKGKVIRVLEDNAALLKKQEDYRISKKEFFTFKTSEGVELHGWMIKPYTFKKNREYPVFMTCYGGPGVNTVNNSWSYNDLYYQFLASKGYIVASVDNRGTGYRGEEFKKSTYLQLGKLESIDQIEAAQYLADLPYVDGSRIGIQGWSFGGYLSSLALLKGGDVFKMAIAVAPVTNWRYYDNIYTERFLRKPQDNPEGYDDNSPINFVKNLKGKYLIIHGTADDNVHVQNTIEMVNALNNANKQFDMHIYPNKNHSIFGGYTRYHLFNKMTLFIDENL
jgi:dipeptidyl-peptidase-4